MVFPFPFSPKCKWRASRAWIHVFTISTGDCAWYCYIQLFRLQKYLEGYRSTMSSLEALALLCSLVAEGSLTLPSDMMKIQDPQRKQFEEARLTCFLNRMDQDQNSNVDTSSAMPTLNPSQYTLATAQDPSRPVPSPFEPHQSPNILPSQNRNMNPSCTVKVPQVPASPYPTFRIRGNPPAITPAQRSASLNLSSSISSPQQALYQREPGSSSSRSKSIVSKSVEFPVDREEPDWTAT